MAILLDEPQAGACMAALESEAEILISAGTVAEALVVSATRNVGEEMARLIDGLGFDAVFECRVWISRVCRGEHDQASYGCQKAFRAWGTRRVWLTRERPRAHRRHMMRGSRACGRLLVVALLLLPSLAFAASEVWLVIGTIEPSDAPPDLTFGREAFRPEAGAIALREGEVTVMPTCEAGINLGFRSAPGASPREKTVVRLQKKRIASGCALEVLHIGIEGRRSVGTDGSLPPAPRTSGVPSIADPRHLDDRAVPCGAELIEVRQSPLGGSSLHVKGIGESGECHEATDSVESPLSIRWLDPPPAEAANALTAPATAPR